MSDTPIRPPRRLERLSAVIARIGMRRSWIYAQLQAGDGRFPTPVKIGGATCWDSEAIDAWIEDRVRRAGEDSAHPASPRRGGVR